MHIILLILCITPSLIHGGLKDLEDARGDDKAGKGPTNSTGKGNMVSMELTEKWVELIYHNILISRMILIKINKKDLL